MKAVLGRVAAFGGGFMDSRVYVVGDLRQAQSGFIEAANLIAVGEGPAFGD